MLYNTYIVIRDTITQIVRQVGSHVIYTKNGKSFAVPDHGSKEMKKGLAQKLIKEMGL